MRRQQTRNFQRGATLWVILIVLVAAIFGAYQYRQSVKNTEQQRQSEIQNQQDAERKALEERQRAEAQEKLDALVTSKKSIEAVLNRWDDAFKVAANTGRGALSGPVGELQKIHRDAEQLIVPPCLDEGKVHLLASMDNTVEGFLTFMRNELKMGDILSEAKFAAAKDHMHQFQVHQSACLAQ